MPRVGLVGDVIMSMSVETLYFAGQGKRWGSAFLLTAGAEERVGVVPVGPAHLFFFIPPSDDDLRDPWEIVSW